MRIGILVPTTKGPIRIAGLRSVPGLPLSQIVEVDEHLPDESMTARYNSLVAKGGPVDALLSLPMGGHILTLTGLPETGRSWELPAALAHWVLARGHSLAPDTADVLIWATGALDAHGTIPAMDYHLASKIDRSSDALGAAARVGTQVVLLRPPETGDVAPARASTKYRETGVRGLPEAITFLDATCEDMSDSAKPRDGRRLSLRVVLIVGGLTLAGGLALWYGTSLQSVPEMRETDGAAASANTDQAGVAVDQAPAPPSQNTVAADTSDEEDARHSKRVADTDTDIAATATSPALTLIERRAPDSGTCRDVLFGAVEPSRITQRISLDGFAPSSLQGLCALTLRWEGEAPARIDLPESLAARLLRSDLVSIPRLAPGEAVTLRLIGDARPTGPYRFDVESDGTTAMVSHGLVTDDSND